MDAEVFLTGLQLLFFFFENNWLPLECKPLMLFVIEPLYSLLLINKQLVLLEAIFLDIFCFN